MEPELRQALDTLAKQQADHAAKQEEHHKTTKKSIDEIKDKVVDLDKRHTVFTAETGRDLSNMIKQAERERQDREKEAELIHRRISEHLKDPDAHPQMYMARSGITPPAGNRITRSGLHESINGEDNKPNRMGWKSWAGIVAGACVVLAGGIAAVAKILYEFLKS